MLRRSRIPQATARAFGAFAVLILATGVAAGASGVIAFRVRDSMTGYAVEATVKIDGAEPGQFGPRSVRTDEFGRLRLDLPAGHYLFEISAPGYEAARTHSETKPGTTLPVTLMAHPENPPEELRPEVLDAKLRPGHTLVQGYVVDAETCRPLPNVRIRVQKAQVETRTNERGYFWVSVPTPPLDAQELPGEDTLIAELPGYRSYVYRNFPVPEGDSGAFALDLERGSGLTEHDATHKLKRRPGGQNETPQSARPSPDARLSPRIYDWLAALGKALPVGATARLESTTPVAITVPTYINVGYKCPTKITCTSVKQYKLEDYVQLGLHKEWPSTWATDSLKAGAVAHRSYGAYFVANPLTSNYDICNTIECQVFDTTVTKPPSSTSAAATVTAGVVLSADNANVFKAEYAEETNGFSECGDGQTGSPAANWPCMADFVCAGTAKSGHPRGMCQFGSQRWATGKDSSGTVVTKARNWQCILDHYYNDNGNTTGAGTGLRTAYVQGPGGNGRIAFSPFDRNQNPDIYVMNADASGLTRVTRDRASDMPTWSPGGDKIAFRKGAHIYSMNADGSGVTQLTPVGTTNWFPSWSASGNRKIAFASPPDPSTLNEIYVMNEDGLGRTRLTSNSYDDLWPSWSPDGTKITLHSTST